MNGHGPPPPPPPDSSFNSDSDSDSDSKSKCKSKSYLFSDHSYPYSYSIPNTPTLLLLRLKLASFHTPWTGPGPRSFRKSDNSNIGLVEGRRAHWLRGWVCRYGRCLFRTLVKKRGASGARPKAHPFFLLFFIDSRHFTCSRCFWASVSSRASNRTSHPGSSQCLQCTYHL